MPKYRITFVMVWENENENEEDAKSYFRQTFSQLDRWGMLKDEKLKVEEI